MENRKSNFIIKLLIMCVVIIMATTSIVYAVFYSNSILKSTAKVGAFIVDVYQNTNQSNNLTLNSSFDTNNTIDYKFSVTNAINSKCSDVNMKYDIIIKLKNKLPNNVTFTLNNKVGSISQDGLKYIFSNMGTFNAGVASTHMYTLKFNVSDIALMFDDISISPIDISVIAEQIN